MINFLLAIIFIIAILDVFFNMRIMKSYASMAKRTSESLAVTPESKQGFKEFFSLCGWGTHGMHVLHTVTELASISTLILFPDTVPDVLQTPEILIPFGFWVFGSMLIHLKQARAVEVVLENFFERDLKIIAKLFAVDGTIEKYKPK